MGRSLFEYVEVNRISDTVWGEAYERTGPLMRSRLKQTIARNRAMLDGPGPRVIRQVVSGRGGEYATSNFPCDWCLVLVGNGFADPTGLLAAAVYPALSGVQNVFVVREAGELQLPDAFLAGLELGGIEDFAECTGEELIPLLYQAGAEKGGGVLLTLGVFSSEIEKILCEVCLPVFRLARSGGIRRVGVVVDGTYQWDWDCLQWAFPRAEYLLAGKGVEQVVKMLPDGLTRRVCEGDFLPEKYDLLLHPLPLQVEDTPASVCLGPGLEGVWVWPELHEKMFQHVRICLLS